jgi:FlgN protein
MTNDQKEEPMIARAPLATASQVLPLDLAQAWLAELRGEAEERARHAQLCQELTAALLAADIPAFQSLQDRQQQLVATGQQREARVALLRRRSATVIGCPESALTVVQVIAAAPASLRGELETLQRQRQDSCGELRRLLDRNALLVRTSLGLTRDKLDILVGPRVGDGYGRRGRPIETITPVGSVFSART